MRVHEEESEESSILEESEHHFPHFLYQCAPTLRLMDYRGAEDQDEIMECLKYITIIFGADQSQ